MLQAREKRSTANISPGIFVKYTLVLWDNVLPSTLKFLDLKINTLFIPYYVKKGFFINKYPKVGWWNYHYRKGFSNNQWVEVIHACCDAPKTGYWMYFAKGSGIEWNTGKTLVANNKIDALHKLGVDFNKMADLFPHFKFRSSNGSWMTWQQMGKIKKIPTLSALFQQAAVGNDFAIARMSNTVELDEIIASLGHQKRFDSVQMTLQPNGNGGWAFEIIDTRQLNYDPPNQQICPPKGTVRLTGSKPCDCRNQSKAIALYCQGQESEKMYVSPGNSQQIIH